MARKPIADGEWRVTLALHVPDQEAPVATGELVYADSYLAGFPPNVDRLVASRMTELAEHYTALGKFGKKRKR